MMKKECNIVRDVLPLYLEKMVSEDTAVFVKEHLDNCSDCAAEFEGLQSGVQIDAEETPQREHDAEVITTVKKKLSKRTVRIVAGVCLVFVGLLIATVLYTSISYPVTKDDISLSTKTIAADMEPNILVSDMEDTSLSTEMTAKDMEPNLPVTEDDISLPTETIEREAEPNIPATEDDVLLSTKTEDGYSYIIMKIEAGKTICFESKTEDILNGKNEVCGQRITLYNLEYYKNFKQEAGFMSWGCPEGNYLEMVVELEDGTLQISNQE